MSSARVSRLETGVFWPSLTLHSKLSLSSFFSSQSMQETLFLFFHLWSVIFGFTLSVLDRKKGSETEFALFKHYRISKIEKLGFFRICRRTNSISKICKTIRQGGTSHTRFHRSSFWRRHRLAWCSYRSGRRHWSDPRTRRSWWAWSNLRGRRPRSPLWSWVRLAVCNIWTVTLFKKKKTNINDIKMGNPFLTNSITPTGATLLYLSSSSSSSSFFFFFFFFVWPDVPIPCSSSFPALDPVKSTSKKSALELSSNGGPPSETEFCQDYVLTIVGKQAHHFVGSFLPLSSRPTLNLRTRRDFLSQPQN